MSTKTKPNPKTYDLEFKKQAVQLVITSGRLRGCGVQPGVSPFGPSGQKRRTEGWTPSHSIFSTTALSAEFYAR